MITDIQLTVKLPDGYLLKRLGNDQYEIHHINGNGIITFKDKISLLTYLYDIDSIFDIK